jgi:hypothetical protein
MSHDVFISYSSKDKNAADAACAVLERNGLRCWIAPRDVLPGVTWGSAIVAAIHEVKLFVLVFSGSANTSPQIEREVERAISTGIPVIPFRIEDVKPSESLEYFISASHWLDAFTQPMEQSLETLAKVARNLIEIRQHAANGTTAAAAAGASTAPAPRGAAMASAVPRQAGGSRWLFAGGGATLAVCAVLAALFFVWPRQAPVVASSGPVAAVESAATSPAPQRPSAQPLAAQPVAANPAVPTAPAVRPLEIQPAPVQPPAAPAPVVAAPDRTAAAQPAAVRPVSLTGRWSWNANCAGALWRGKFDIAESASDRFTGGFAGTEWHDIGTITEGQVEGTNVSFTRTTPYYVQRWKGQIGEGRMEGSLSSDTYACTWQARRD